MMAHVTDKNGCPVGWNPPMPEPEPNVLTIGRAAEIDKLTHEEMARLWRFSPPGHPYFQKGSLSDYFINRFKSLGGFTPVISKTIGWEND